MNKVNQQIGRILRNFPGKDDSIVFDFRDSLVSLAESQYYTRLKQVYHDFDVLEVPYVASREYPGSIAGTSLMDMLEVKAKGKW